MYVLIQKWTDGVRFVPCSKKGKPAKPAVGQQWLSDRAGRALDAAEAWYEAAVNKAFEKRGIADTGYATQFDRAYAKTGKTESFMKLEPVGFAIDGLDGEPAMNDCGSTPTPMRAKVLACYQDPLVKIVEPAEFSDEPPRVRYERVVEVVEEEKHSEALGRKVKRARVVEP